MSQSHETRYKADGKTLTSSPRREEHEVGEVIEKVVLHPKRRTVRMRVTGTRTIERGWKVTHIVEVDVLDEEKGPKSQSRNIGGGATLHRTRGGSTWTEY